MKQMTIYGQYLKILYYIRYKNMYNFPNMEN